jgi:hypothetical protein
MKLAAFDDYEGDRPVLLKLVTHDNEVDLTAVDSHGDPHPKGTLLAIRPCGLYLYPGVSAEIGLPLDNEQRLKLYPAPEPDPEIMDLLKPLAEYMQGRRGSKRLSRWESSEQLKPGITLGYLDSLAAYYERNK